MQPQVLPPEVIAQQVAAQVEQEVMQRPEFALKDAQARKADADAKKAEYELQMAMIAGAQPQQGQPAEQPAQPDPMAQIEHEAIKQIVLGEVGFEFEERRKKLDAGILSYSDGKVQEAEQEPTAIDVLSQALLAQGELIKEGMSQMAAAFQSNAQAQMAPTRLIRDDKGRAIGAEKVM
jgi:hypothetical protein